MNGSPSAAAAVSPLSVGGLRFSVPPTLAGVVGDGLQAPAGAGSTALQLTSGTQPFTRSWTAGTVKAERLGESRD